ncbi:MAG: DUF6868 family protein [Planctomycetota bacterium]
MTVQTLTSFFMWCMIFDAGLLIVTFLMYLVAGDAIYRLHSRWFSISRETFDVVFYSFLGGMKILWWVFNVVPYIALLILA